MIRFIQFLINFNIYIAISACSLFIYSLKLFSLPLLMEDIAFVFFGTLLTYRGQNFIKSRIRQKAEKQQVGPSLTIMILSFLMIIFLFFYFPLVQVKFYVLIPVFLLCFFYAFPFTRGKSTANLRNLPYAKLFIIAFVWAIVCALYPLFKKGNLDFGHWIWVAAVFFFIIGITIPFDIRDLKYDPRDMKTIPQIFGIVKSKQLASLSIVTSFFLFIVLIYFNKVSTFHSLLFSSLCFINMVLIQLSALQKNGYFYSGLIDGSMILLLLSLCS